MKKVAAYWGLLLAVVLTSSCTLKYAILKDTSLVNPPHGPIKIYIKEFPVESKASVVDPLANGADQQQGDQYITNELAKVGNKLIRISRPSRIEDLSGVLLRELRKDRLRVFSQLELIKALDEDSVREIRNPFELVSADEADLEISGTARILSQKVRKVFSQTTQDVEVEVQIKDLKTDRTNEISPLKAGVVMIFNSRELEEALSVAVMTSLTQKLLF